MPNFKQTAPLRQSEPLDQTPSLAISVLTDMHFWIPVAVLSGGLLLLRLFH